MKFVFQALAAYNSSVNGSLLALIEPLKKEEIMMETKAYYPSIFQTLLHVFLGDLTWLRRYREVLKENKCLNTNTLLSLERKKPAGGGWFGLYEAL